MLSQRPKTILCIASYEKGEDFMLEAKERGSKVYLLTSKSLEHAAWPRESLDDIFYIQNENKDWNVKDVIKAVSYLARTVEIDRIVAFDDVDVEKAASLREHLRISGMGDTTARYFRDKLAMRMRASEVGIAVPEFTHILNYNNIKKFVFTIPFPYVAKHRLKTGSLGVKKINNEADLWKSIDELGDEQSFYLIERFIPGTIYHVDTIIYNREIAFAQAHQYSLPPLETANQNRVFSTSTVIHGSEDEEVLLMLNRKVLAAFGIVMGTCHTEFIKGGDGKFYFLETSARVGGGHIAELVEASSGINLWREWAKIEVLGGIGKYLLPERRNEYAGLLISPSREKVADISEFDDEEIVWRFNKNHLVGLIVCSNSHARVKELLDSYTSRFYQEFVPSQSTAEMPKA